MTAPFVWFHNSSATPTEAAAFYEKLLGWNVSEGPPGMTMLARDAGPFAAIAAKKVEAEGWVPYVQVDDVVAATKRALALGAQLLEPETRGPAGTYSVVRDPGGALVALWQKS
jgi:predicted enzyme related to lactoylglutathione lyase